MPEAVQAMTTGDSLVTTRSVGSSAIDGGTKKTTEVQPSTEIKSTLDWL